MDAPDFVLSSAGKIGIGTASPTSKVQILGGSLSVGSQSTYALGVGSSSGYDLTFGTDSSYAYIQSWTSKPLQINSQGNNVIFPNSNVGIGTASVGQLFHVHNTSNYVGMLINGSNAPQLCFAQGVSTTPTWKVGISGNDGTAFSISSGTVNADRIVIGSSGRVAVGDSVSTGAQLAVGGALKVNRSIYNWYQSGTNSWDGYQYLHLKTGLWGGGGGTGNSSPTMSLFSAKLFSYSSNYIREGNLAFHNWSGSIYSQTTTGTIWSGAYVSSDGYIVLVVALGGGSYQGVTIDWHQSYGYPFQDKFVTSTNYSNSSSNLY